MACAVARSLIRAEPVSLVGQNAPTHKYCARTPENTATTGWSPDPHGGNLEPEAWLPIYQTHRYNGTNVDVDAERMTPAIMSKLSVAWRRTR
jgi:hypothetical protein